MPTPHKPKKPVANLERERLTSLINSMADGVVATDKDLRLIVYNGAALNIFNLKTLKEGDDLSGILKLIEKNKKHETTTNILKQRKVATIPRDHQIT